jgi:hypothetical protein
MSTTESLLPVLDTSIDFMETALAENQALRDKIAGLTSKLAQQEKVVLEKVAAERVLRLDTFVLEETLTKLANMGILDSAMVPEIKARMGENPNKLMPFILKLAETLTLPSGEGSGVAPEEKLAAEEDPDGWGAFYAGRPVRIKK